MTKKKIIDRNYLEFRELTISNSHAALDMDHFIKEQAFKISSLIQKTIQQEIELDFYKAKNIEMFNEWITATNELKKLKGEEGSSDESD